MYLYSFLAASVGVLLGFVFLYLNVPISLLSLLIGRPQYGIGSLVHLPYRKEPMLIKNVRVRPPYNGNKMMWVYDGIVLGTTEDLSIEYLTGIFCVPERGLRSIPCLT